VRVSIANLSFSYPGKDVLKNVNLSLGSQEVLCVTGPNGSGKSTLVKCIEGINRAQSGKIFLDGEDSAGLSRQDMAKLIGYVPQSSNQLFSSTVFDTVLMGRKPHYNWRCCEEDVHIVAEILQLLDLGGLAMDDYNKLSGGQQQRVLIARALAQQPKMLLLDEPTSALDISHQLEVMEIISDLVKKHKISVIMVIHDLNLASRYADSIMLLKEGEVYASGSAENTLTETNIEHVYGVEANIHIHDGTLSVTPVRRVGKSK